MNGIELDRKLRAILATVTPETSLSAAQKIAALGFGARTAWFLVEAHLTGVTK